MYKNHCYATKLIDCTCHSNVGTERVNFVIIEVLVFIAIIYFILFVICHWLLSTYGNTFTRSNSWIIEFIEQKLQAQQMGNHVSKQQLANDGSEKYQKFQEPRLIAVQITDFLTHNMHKQEVNVLALTDIYDYAVNI